MIRESGYYWVKKEVDGYWSINKWDDVCQVWSLDPLGLDAQQKDFPVVNETRIKTPNEVTSATVKGKYYLSPFNFFYTEHEQLGDKFSMSAFGQSYTSESESFDLSTALLMIAKGYQDNEDDFTSAGVYLEDLLKEVLKRDYNES